MAACGASDGSGWPAEETARTQQGIQGGYVDNQTSGVVGLGIFEQDHFFAGHCSGTLIAPNLVLTARHCVTQISLDEDAARVLCGQTEFRATRDPDSLFASPETRRPNNPNDPSFARGRSLHPVPEADDVCGYDVALIILDENIDTGDAVPIVPRIDRTTESDEAFSASGYGLTEDDENASSGQRMRIDGNVVSCSTSECQTRFPDVVTETEWLSVDAGVCSGDSGGPALDAEGKVIGVASRGGPECRATIYGDVAAWADFIIEIALEAAELGGYEPPFWTAGTSDLSLADPVPTESDDDASDDVVLDEPALDEDEEVSAHGDLECDPAECDEGPQLAAESGCALASRPAGGSNPLVMSLVFFVGFAWRARARKCRNGA